MSAKHAVLGLVIERPGHGYDLARRLRERFGSSGFAPTGVYSALDQLSAESLVRATGSLAGGTAERAAPRTIYEATDRGRERFDRWIRSNTSLAHVRDELNMKFVLSRPQDVPALIEQASAQERDCMARLEELKRLAGRGARRSGALPWPEVAELLVRDAEFRQLQARIEWLQRARTIMARLVQASPAEHAPADRRERSEADGPQTGARVA